MAWPKGEKSQAKPRSGNPKYTGVKPEDIVKPQPRTRYGQLKAEYNELRDAMEMPKRTLEDWLEMPEAFRDRLAGEAYFREKGMKPAAIMRLGFVVPKNESEKKELYAAVFDTPGAQVIIERDLEDAEVNRKPLLARMINIGLYGDDESAVRSVQLVARMAGWKLEPENVTNIDARRVTLLQIIGNAPSEATAIQPPAEEVQEAFLAHDPGEPVRVSSDDNIDAMLESEQE